MKFIADFHIHSHFSIATSKSLTPEHLEYWAKLKGINVIGTGDCIHPGWFMELQEKLEPAGNGLFRLKEKFRLKELRPPNKNNIPDEVYFVLTGEVSSIYKKGGRVRKVHNLCVFPDFESAKKVQEKLARVGNIASDGRPILGLDSKHLLEMTLESSDTSFLIPAHIWTPWFSVLGSKSGFDSIEECYEDLTPHIFAVETGLSSDPPMNRVCSFLDPFKLVSNSDAHSPEKLGREANIFNTELSYAGIYNSLKGDTGFLGTIEFFPQEGKYHYDGHRKCGIRWDPLETISKKGVCTQCGKPVTAGVMFRVAELADRPDLSLVQEKTSFSSITSLPDLLAEIYGLQNSRSKKVRQSYMKLIEKLGSEFHILLDAEIETIRKAGGDQLAVGIQRLRQNNVQIEEGYDGKFGRVRVFTQKELDSFSGASLFAPTPAMVKSVGVGPAGSVQFDIERFQKKNEEFHMPVAQETECSPKTKSGTKEQRAAIHHENGPCLVVAGPGSGKTRVLTERIVHLISKQNISPDSILAVTFSNKAAKEIEERIKKRVRSSGVRIATFHGFGLSILQENCERFGRFPGFSILDSEEKKQIIEKFLPEKRSVNRVLLEIGNYKQGIEAPDQISDEAKKYEDALRSANAFDFDDLISLPVLLWNETPAILTLWQKRIQWILIDEYQDINARQYEMMRLLAPPPNANLFVIGDPDQAIYGFRGSDVRFIETLKEDYPSLLEILLNKSYRCPAGVLKAAGQILEKKEYGDGTKDQVKIHIQSCQSEKSEADWIAERIEQMMGGVRSFSMDSGISDGEAACGITGFTDFAILCRTSEMFDPFMKAFDNHGIPYQLTGTEPFYKRDPLCSLLKELQHVWLKQFTHTSTDDETHKLEKVAQKMIDGARVSEMIIEAAEIFEMQSKDLKRLVPLAEGFGSAYDKFFIFLALAVSADDYDKRAESVSLMTIHASKGLEFPAIFIPGCEEGIIPFELFGTKSVEERKEEERLFYVGITRTKRHLILSHTKKRYIRGRTFTHNKSPFLNRLEKDLIQNDKRNSKTKHRDERQMSLF